MKLRNWIVNKMHIKNHVGLFLTLAVSVSIGLSGCLDGADLPGDEEEHPNEPLNGQNSDTGNTHSSDPVVWTEAVEHTGNAPNFVCAWLPPGGACLMETHGFKMPEFSYDNATMLGLDATIAWEEGDLPALFGREVTLSCDDAKGGSCETFPEPSVFEQDEPPMHIDIPDLDLPPNTRLEVYIAIRDPAQDPLQVEFDVSRAYSLEGTMALEGGGTR